MITRLVNCHLLRRISILIPEIRNRVLSQCHKLDIAKRQGFFLSPITLLLKMAFKPTVANRNLSSWFGSTGVLFVSPHQGPQVFHPGGTGHSTKFRTRKVPPPPPRCSAQTFSFTPFVYPFIDKWLPFHILLL